MSEKLPPSPYIILAIGILAVSTASIFIRYAQLEAASIVVAAYRMIIAAAFLSPVAFFGHRKAIGGLTLRQLGLAALSGAFLATHFTVWITSLEYTSVASSVVIVTTTPLWVALASPLTIKEPITRRTAVGLAVALGGTVLIGVSDACTFSDNLVICPSARSFFQERAIIGDLLALLGAWTAAGYVIIGRSLRNRLGLVPYISVVYSIAAVILSLLMVFSGEMVWGFSLNTWLWLLLLGIVPQLLGHSTFNWSLGFLPASIVALTLLGEPVGSSILAYVFLGEKPGMITIFGGILILAGIFIAATNTEKRNPLV